MKISKIVEQAKGLIYVAILGSLRCMKKHIKTSVVIENFVITNLSIENFETGITSVSILSYISNLPLV